VRPDEVRGADEKLAEAVAARVQVGSAEALHALRDLACWIPGVFPMEKGVYGEDPNDPEDQLHDAPFVSEAYLYALLGKEEARSFLCRFDAAARALGVVGGHHDLQEAFFIEREAAAKEEEERQARMRENATRYKAEGHTFKRGKPCAACGEEGFDPATKKPKCRHWPLARLVREIKS
jgi:hypothetical protein